MRSATLITLDYPPERGGVARYLGELVRVAGGEISVVVEQNHDLHGPGEVIPRELIRGRWPRWWPMVGVCKEFGKKSTALLISHVLPVGTAAMIAGVPYVVICHGLDVRIVAARPLKRWLFTRVCRSALAVVANSQATAQEVRKIAGVTPTVITPGVAMPKQIDREEARRRVRAATDEAIILCVTRLMKRKGVDVLLEATESFADGKNVRVVVIGDGPERATLTQMVEHMKHRITLIHEATDAEIADWYAAADVFCMPPRDLPDDMEGFGIVYLEAAAHGLPVVATDTGGIREAVVDGVTGILVPPGDVEALSQALQRVLNNPVVARTLGDAGRERVSRDFRWEDRWGQLRALLAL
jgi:phosphatidylinositol alpha-1,6-mannosyltransferase